MLALAGLVPAAVSAETYTVQPGDSLSAIADRFGVTEGVLRTLNPALPGDDLLYVGTVLSLPDNAVDSGDAARLTHTIQPGETLTQIAARYGVTVAQVLALNPGLDPDLLFWGFTIVIRDAASPTPSSPASASPAPSLPATPAPAPPLVTMTRARQPYVVQPGDSLSGIAARLGVTIAEILVLNPSLSADTLYAGTVIAVPAGAAVPTTAAAAATTTAATTPATTTAGAVTSTSFLYTVVPGDSASAIAARYGLTLAQLQAANNAVFLATVYVGQRLRIPGTRPPIPAAGGGSITAAGGGSNTDGVSLTTYTVRPGDSASAIAARFGMTLAQLAALNPDVNLDVVLIGQVLHVPNVDLPPPAPGTVPAGAPGPNRYTVVPGDTLSAIAERAGTTLPEIQRLNPQITPNLLSVGQALHLPGTEPVPTVSRVVNVAAGDSIEFVAARLGVTPTTLLANNPGLDPGWIPAGTPLRAPDGEGTIVPVEAGDTLLALAARHGVSMAEILASPRSGVTDANRLIQGQEILIPLARPAFAWPARGDLTDGFGACRTADCSSRHHGVDISQHETPGGPVLAIADGVVTFAGGTYCCGLGMYVEIDHGNGWVSRYGHLLDIPPVSAGQQVRQGEGIGYSGTTGWSTGVHLHLELEYQGYLLDALNYLP